MNRVIKDKMNVKIVGTSSRRTVLAIFKKTALLVGIIVCGDTAGTIILSILLRQNFFHYYTLLTLVEAGLLFLVGSAIELDISFTVRRIGGRATKNERKFNVHKGAQQIAAPCIVGGTMLFILSFALAYPLG